MARALTIPPDLRAEQADLRVRVRRRMIHPVIPMSRCWSTPRVDTWRQLFGDDLPDQWPDFVEAGDGMRGIACRTTPMHLSRSSCEADDAGFGKATNAGARMNPRSSLLGRVGTPPRMSIRATAMPWDRFGRSVGCPMIRVVCCSSPRLAMSRAAAARPSVEGDPPLGCMPLSNVDG